MDRYKCSTSGRANGIFGFSRRLGKRTLCAILVLCLLFTQIPVSVHATTDLLTVTPTFTGTNTASAFAVNSSNTYNLTFDIVGTDIAEPILVITVPKGITVSYYPTATNAILGPSLASVNPVTFATDESGNTVLTYRFRADITTIGFNITLCPTLKLDETTYTVSATYFDGTTVKETRNSSVTISDNPCFNPNIGNFRTNKNSVLLIDGTTDYYVAYRSDFYCYNYGHYAYDSITAIVPIAAESVPGLGQGTSFSAFVSGTSYDIGSGTSAFSVKYYENYSFKNAANTEIATGRALVFTFPSTHQFTSDNYYITVTDNIYMKYTVSSEMISSKRYTPQMIATVGSDNYVILDYYNYTSYSDYYYYCIGCEFKTFHITDYLYLNNESIYASGYYNYLFPIEGNTQLSSRIMNNLGETVHDLSVRYTIPKELYANKITFNLVAINGGTLPTQASVSYKTSLGGDTVYTQNMTVDLNTITLSDVADAITYMEVVFDKLDTSSGLQELIRIWIANRENLASATKTITDQIFSADSVTYGTLSALPQVTYVFYLQQKLEIYMNVEVSPAALNKGDNFNIQFYTTSYQALLTDPCFYFVIPKGYIYMGYTAPYNYTDVTYSVTTRDLGDNILYIIKYTDGISRYSYYTSHSLQFKVGPSIPTSAVQTVSLPVAVYAENHNAIYPFSTNASYSYTDVNDYNGNSSTTDALYKVYSMPTATINAVSAMTAQSFLTTSIAIGENTEQQYVYDSTGSYKYYMYNGLQVGNDAHSLTIDVSVPRNGSSVTYNSTAYTSQFDALMTGAVTLTGAMFAGAAVTYKLSGSEAYVSDVGGAWGSVTDIRIVTAAGVSLAYNNTAIIEVPFEVSGYTSATTTNYRAYFDTEMAYKLTTTGETVHVAKIAPCALKPMKTNITGTIYKDYNSNNTIDANESSNYRYFTCSLYEGTDTSGTSRDAVAVNTSNGRFTLGVINTGTYTLKVNKTSSEYYPSWTTDLFDDDGCYTFTIGSGSSDVITDLELGIVSPRSVSLNFTSVIVIEGTTRVIVPTLSPGLLAGEDAVTYLSSDTGVATVAGNGTITYVGDGTATITVTTPQLASFTTLAGGSTTITNTVNVTCQQAGCHITAAPYLTKGGSAITGDTIQLTEGSSSFMNYRYYFNRGGYCNATPSHALTCAAEWTIVDDGGTGAVLSSSGNYSSYYGYTTLTVTNSGTVTLKASETWTHDASLKPDDITITINVYDQYAVSLPSGTGFNCSAYYSNSIVNHGGSFSFTVMLGGGYDQSSITVRSNGTVLTANASGIYTVSDIQEDKAITVEGVAPNIYSVTLNKDLGTVSSGDITSYTYGTGATLPTSATISKSGYTFNGWTATANTSDIAYITGISASSTGNKVYYAKWTAIPAVPPALISGTGNTLTYGYSTGLIGASTSAGPGQTITGYQWYTCDYDGSNKSMITDDGTDPNYYIPAGKDAGTYYYICRITVTRTDNGQQASAYSDVITLTIDQKTLTADATADDKTYDGTTEGTGSIALLGIVGSDAVAASGTFIFADADANTGITVNVTGITLSGADASNYTYNTTDTSEADIQKATLTVTVDDSSKTYGSVNPEFTVYVTGFLHGETAATASGYTTPAANCSATVSTGAGTSNIYLSGGSADNYSFNISDTGILTTTATPITATVVASNKGYDGTATATGTVMLHGVINNDIVTATAVFMFNDFNPGEGKPVTATGITLSGHDAGNYTVNTTASATANIVYGASPDTGTGVNILVNGIEHTAATSNTTEVDDRSITTITVNDDMVNEKINSEGNNSVVTIPVGGDPDAVVGELNGQTVRNMEDREAVLEIKTDDVTYTLPASQINIGNISQQLGNNVELKDIKVSVTISIPEDDTVQVIQDTADSNNYQLVVKPVEFTITCSSGGETVEVEKFNGYVERMIAIPEGVDPSKITTGIILNDDGSFTHIPTTIVVINGKYYAKLNSLTNSTYSVIWNPITFKDMIGHWAEEAVNDMGSRLVVTGKSEDNYDPDGDMTRGDFASVIVKALGLLRTGEGQAIFSDVTLDDPNFDAICIAYEYGLINGYGDGKFGPDDTITREQAMVMIARAMDIAEIETEMGSEEESTILSAFADAKTVSAWARRSAAECIRAGVVMGRTATAIDPSHNVSRAEIASMIRRFLIKAELITD
ncbi:MAG: S-layer homology domain-containing protein [Clostridia bacterium]